MNFSNGRIWPYTISFLIILVFGFCVATVIVTSTVDIQESDLYMNNYHDVDKDINDIITAKIAFNKKYKVEFLSDNISVESTVFKFIMSDLDLNRVDGAEFDVIVNGITGDFKINLEKPISQNGVYLFKSIQLPKEGKWNILVKVEKNGLYRYYNLKTDTRTQEIYDTFHKLEVGKKTKKLLI